MQGLPEFGAETGSTYFELPFEVSAALARPTIARQWISPRRRRPAGTEMLTYKTGKPSEGPPSKIGGVKA
jgi:hypothetical protein